MERSHEAQVHKEALKLYDDAWEYDRDNRTAGLDDLGHLNGTEQWPADERKRREDEGRPCLTVNRLPQQVRQVTGDLRRNRPSVRVRPVDGQNDPEVAKIYSGLIRNIEARSKKSKPYVTAGIQAAQCGIGHFRVLTDYAHAETFEQDIFLEPIHNPFAVVWDPQSRLSTRADANFCFVTERMEREAFKRAYPKAQLIDFEEGDSREDVTQWFDENTVRIAEYWCKKPVKRQLARLADGQIINLDDLGDEARAALESSEGIVQEVREITTHEVVMYKISGAEILEGPTYWPTPDIPIIAVAGEEIVREDKVTRLSVIRHAKDPQRMYNYWTTNNAEFVALQPKQPYIADFDSIAPFLPDWMSANAKNVPVLTYKSANGAPPPQRQAPAQVSTALVHAMGQAADDIKATTGVYDAALGMRSNETSGVAIEARQHESDISTFFVSDNVTAAVEQCGRILVDLIPRIYDTQRQLRIVNPDETEEFVEVNRPVMVEGGYALENDLSVGRFDVDVSTGPSYSTARQEAADSLIKFGQAYPMAAPLIMDLVAKNMDWPGADEIAERLRKTLPPQLAEGDDDSPEAMAQAQAAQQQAMLEQQRQGLALAKEAAEVQETQADAAKASADAEKARAEAAETLMRVMVESGQLEQLVSAAVAQQVAMIVQQPSAPPVPGLGT